MKIEELLNKYFEGLTTCEEERRLRHYFTREKNLPHEWEIYRWRKKPKLFKPCKKRESVPQPHASIVTGCFTRP